MVVAETERLFLKKFSDEDIDGFFDLNNDPEVIQYTGDKPFESKQAVSQFISQYDQYERFGFGRWSLYQKQSNQYIGFCGLRYSVQAQEIDIGFRIARIYWGKGYATESAKAALNIAFSDCKVERVVSKAMINNFASLAVIKKLGMQYHSKLQEDGLNWLKYELFRDDWRLSRSKPI